MDLFCKGVPNKTPPISVVFLFDMGFTSGGFEGGAVVNDAPVARQSRD